MKKRLMNIKKERKIEEDEKRLKNTFDFFTVLNSIQLCKVNAYTKKIKKKLGARQSILQTRSFSCFMYASA